MSCGRATALRLALSWSRTSIQAVALHSPISLTAVGDTLYFYADDGISGRELWKSDGTEAGTVLVKDINPGSGGSSPIPRKQSNSRRRHLVTSPPTTASRHELWKSDGTEEGTVLVKDINSGSGTSSPRFLTAVGDTLYFSADEGVNGFELWRSDGTVAGTVLVQDINPSGNSFPRSLTAVGDMLYFSADDGVNDRELWKSDGTEAGTVLLQDINPSGSSFPLST